MSKHNRTKQLRKRVFDIIQIGQRLDTPSLVFDYFLVANILINICALLLLTFDLDPQIMKGIGVVEDITTIVFLIDHLLRIWTADLLYPLDSRPKAIWKYLISFDGIVNICSIIPVIALSGLSTLRIIKVVRIFHLFRLNTELDSFNVIVSVIKEKKKQITVSVFIILILMIASSLCMYNVENEAQPEVFSNAFSGLWWSVSTILTVGYGDIYPITTLGKSLAIVIALLGVGVVAIPTGIISAGFMEYHTKLDNSNDTNIYRKLINDYDKLSDDEVKKLKDIINIIDKNSKGTFD